MAVAKLVRQVKPMNLDWLEIEDEEGVRYCYAKRDQATSFDVVHVGWKPSRSALRAGLIRGADGRVVLRQDEPGLPKTIIVDWAESAGGSPLPMRAFWGGEYEYEQG